MPRRVTFKNQKGERLAGILDVPFGKGPFPAVVICHGFKGRKDELYLQTIATALARSGIVAFRFDFTKNPGESQRPFFNLLFSQMLRDLSSALDFLARQPFIQQQRLGIVGHSLGGQIVLTYAPKDKRVKAVVDLAGVVHRENGKTHIEQAAKQQEAEAKKRGYFIITSSRTKKKFRINYQYWLDLQKQNTPAQVKKIKVPTLIIHGSKDERVPLYHARLAYRLLGQPKSLRVIKGMNHTWRRASDTKYRNQVNKLVTDWFTKHL